VDLQDRSCPHQTRRTVTLHNLLDYRNVWSRKWSQLQDKLFALNIEADEVSCRDPSDKCRAHYCNDKVLHLYSERVQFERWLRHHIPYLKFFVFFFSCSSKFHNSTFTLFASLWHDHSTYVGHEHGVKWVMDYLLDQIRADWLPLWSSGQSSWPQIYRPEFDSRRC
jgi:hypothetical protein